MRGDETSGRQTMLKVLDFFGMRQEARLDGATTRDKGDTQPHAQGNGNGNNQQAERRLLLDEHRKGH